MASCSVKAIAMASFAAFSAPSSAFQIGGKSPFFAGRLAASKTVPFPTLRSSDKGCRGWERRGGASSSAAAAGGACLRMATWSDARAVREYQDFLSSGRQSVEIASDGPSVIVASSASPDFLLPQALVALGRGDDVVLTPDQIPPAALGGKTSYPIYVAIPPFELKAFLKELGDAWKPRREDFVFFSGGPHCGCIEKELKDCGMCRDATTQVLASGFSLPSLESGGKPVDLSVRMDRVDANGEEKWAGESAACGNWSGAVAERLERNGIRCRTGFYREWRRFMWEQAVLDAVFNLIGAVRSEPTTLQDVALYYGNEIGDMCWQISSNLRGGLAVTLLYGFEERMMAFATQRGRDVPCQIKDEMYPYTYKMFERSAMLMEYLWYAKDMLGLLKNVELPLKRGMIEKPIMRQGNLRADGVI